MYITIYLSLYINAQKTSTYIRTQTNIDIYRNNTPKYKITFKIIQMGNHIRRKHKNTSTQIQIYVETKEIKEY